MRSRRVVFDGELALPGAVNQAMQERGDGSSRDVQRRRCTRSALAKETGRREAPLLPLRYAAQTTGCGFSSSAIDIWGAPTPVVSKLTPT
jgi:hypothetical protein